MTKIRKFISRNISEKNKNIVSYLISYKNLHEYKYIKNKKKIFYMLVPNHGNLGDQAIAYASIKFLKDNFKDYEIIEVSFLDTYKFSAAIKYSISSEDIIFLHGGGNMGNHYVHEEKARRFIIDTFKQNKIISFTQTIYFSDDDEGNNEFRKTKNIYNSHENLTIIAREDKSYEIMNSNFENINILRCPDIVFYLNNKLESKNYNRYKIMTCLRKDKETYLDLDKKEYFIRKLKETYKDILISDTIINEVVSKNKRESVLLRLWKDFYESKVVITDRLHGMIFCAITKTPCIVARSLDHKILESHKWISDLNYIRIIEKLDLEEIKPIIDELSSLDYIDDFDFDTIHFNSLINKINL